MSNTDDGSAERTRRRFLCGLALYCGAGAVMFNGRAIAGANALRRGPVPEPLGSVVSRRSLALWHTHTGERLEVDYFHTGEYPAASLAQVNHFLRDFRTGEVHPIDPNVLDILFLLQVRANRSGVFEVISGYRSPTTNSMLRRTTEGVAQHSLHLQGRAIDVRLEGFSTARLAALARSAGLGGVGFYRRSDFVHVDTGRVRFW